MFPEAKPRGTLRVEEKQNSPFPEGPVIKCFVFPPNSKIDKNAKSDLLDPLVTSPAYERRSKPSCPTETTQ